MMALQAEAQRLAREAEQRQRRLVAIGTETQAWTARAASAAQQLASFDERHAALTAEQAGLAGRPAEIAAERSALDAQLASARAARAAQGTALAAAETEARTAERALKAEEATLMAAREARARAEAQAEQAAQSLEAATARIRERLDCAPDAVLSTSGIAADEVLPPLPQIEQRLERLTRERDTMGPVNLRADQEAQELDTQLDTMQAEKSDLLAAIGKLRQAIGALNREGRERLLAAFETVNTHFQDLFAALFGGGRAHLQLAIPPLDEGALDGEQRPSTDPLDAGLEVMASPPGKKLQTLSLLSGGEQALTALALLFAVFLTTPAPICVLDEVDAPLDDANVDRFCKLLDTITARTQTRFVVVTHHRMTMARMDRLFGVTMAERGVSQLVSVDLAQAERMRATA